ncbi:hypothetical protein [Rhodomicrobium vannielii]|uniref:hypothetical protein n=1 Tax=Rhodomicrobium vannielii TaxID=1069 RepID=UPI001130FE65|nr:hypothetical protein [Rhodomicrobium vannielii]
MQRIRCESRQAIKTFALTPDNFAKLRDDEHGSAPLRPERVSRLIKPGLRDAAIGYTFQFDIFESDGTEASTSFNFPFSNGSFSLGVGGGETKKRQAKRDFDLAERFDELLSDTSLKCEPGRENWKYPVTGEVGMNEVVETFIRLAGLSPVFVNPGTSKRDVYSFTDKLTFSTSYDGSVTPSVTLRPVTHDFRLTQASAKFEATRFDVHSVTVALSAPPVDKPTSERVARSRSQAVQPGDSDDAKASVLRTLQNRRQIDLLREGD